MTAFVDDEPREEAPPAVESGIDQAAEHEVAEPVVAQPESAPAVAPDQPGWFVRLLRFVLGPPAPSLLSQVRELTMAIAQHPEAPVNYVLRGEALLKAGDYAAAQADLETGLALAESGAENADWGYINTALAERARVGLGHCQREQQIAARWRE